MDLIWGLYLQNQVSGVQATANDANSKATEQQFRIKQLEQSIEKLVLINMAMWELIRSKTDLADADLMKKMQEIDLRDGVADGRVTPSVQACPKCGRTVSNKHHRCLYCGQDMSGNAFQTVR